VNYKGYVGKGRLLLETADGTRPEILAATCAEEAPVPGVSAPTCGFFRHSASGTEERS
jgi:hypothetical protein